MDAFATQLPFAADIRRYADKVTVVIAGEITEQSHLEKLVPDMAGAQSVTIDAFGVTRVNSVGVRAWVNFMNALESIAEIAVLRCSPPFVAEMNSVFNFRGRARVKSIVAPFFCSTCDAEHQRVIDIPETVGSPGDLVSGNHICPDCGTRLEFDDLPERYFMFLVQ